MGTSTSSKGGGPRSPFDPEWLDGPASGGDAGNVGDGNGGEGGEGGDGADDENTGDDNDGQPKGNEADAPGDQQPVPLIPARRLAGARAALSGALRGGGSEHIKSAAKRMVGRGMGGPARAARTMRATAQGAGALGQFLTQARDGTNPRVVDWVARVRAAKLSANDLILEIVREVLPNSGSVDEESLRNAATETLSQLYETSPDVDVLGLTDQQIADVIGFTVAYDICNRMDLLLGQTYEKLKYTPQQVQACRNDVREYVQGLVRVELDKLGPRPVDTHGLARDILSKTLEVFGE
ncbi:Qat anti-phage system associated protein QatB [Robbsia sp. KACC 23696]|uniref:Qat anti-phage system associated protein QatB n=1 Tax=Robbsia sp. KACC 23696 TaxID=3149231 RepID=UPI00325A8F98